MKRRLPFFLFSIPIGAIAGGVCAFVVVLECTGWSQVFGRYAHQMTLDLALGYAAFVALSAACIGGVLLPSAYLIVLRQIPGRKIGRAIGCLFAGVLLPSIVFSMGEEFVAFCGAIVAFVVSCFWIAMRFEETPNQSPEPTRQAGGSS